MKYFLLALALVYSVTGFAVSENENDIWLAQINLGGGYSDNWYLEKDTISTYQHINTAKLYRDGKSGQLRTSLKVNCRTKSASFSDAIVWETVSLSNDEISSKVPNEVVWMTISALCK